MKILVVGRDRATEILTGDTSAIGAVISIVSPTTYDREFGVVDWSIRPKGLENVPKQLLLSFDDVSETTAELAGYTCPQSQDIDAILKFGRELELGEKTLLIHCMAGQSRSTASAFMLLCQELGSGREHEAIAKMYQASEEDRLRPNTLMVRYADYALRRNGAMTNTVESLIHDSLVLRFDCREDAISCMECRAELGTPHGPCTRSRLRGPVFTMFTCGPSKDHECDKDGPVVAIERGESASCSKCGLSAFDRSVWEDD